MPDELDKLAVGLAADHQAAKRGKRAGAKAADDAKEAGSPADEAQALGKVVGDAVTADAVEGAAELRDAVGDLGKAVEQREADDDRATDLMVDRLVAIAEQSGIDRATMVGDVRDTLLDLFKANPKPWSTLEEEQQRRIADALETAAKVIIRAIVVIVAEDSAGDAAIHAKLESYAEKGGLKIALTANGDRDTVMALHDAVGQQVVVRRADTNRYASQRRDPAIDPDQPGLAFEGDGHPERSLVGPDGDDDLTAAAEGLNDDRDAE